MAKKILTYREEFSLGFLADFCPATGNKGKGRGKVHPRTDHEGPEGE